MVKTIYILSGIILLLIVDYRLNNPFIKSSKNDIKSQFTQQNCEEIQDGDIFFQTSQSAQSKAIQLATHSTYSHCGMIFKIGNKYFCL